MMFGGVLDPLGQAVTSGLGMRTFEQPQGSLPKNRSYTSSPERCKWRSGFSS